MTPQITLARGERVPALGQGTWTMGEVPAKEAVETEALRLGIELGLTMIDTAEMYGDGLTESFLGRALDGLRDEVFLVSKAYPENAGAVSLPQACERSLRRLRTDRIDLYLLHWRGSVPLGETVAAMEALKRTGKIRHWGVSNFDTDDMEELLAAGGTGCAVNQILYNPSRRGPEFDLIPWLDDHGIAMTAYSPVEQGRLQRLGGLDAVAARHGATVAQVALAWALRRPQHAAIPKAATPDHVRENRAALDLALTGDDYAEIDRALPPPGRKVPLAML